MKVDTFHRIMVYVDGLVNAQDVANGMFVLQPLDAGPPKTTVQTNIMQAVVMHACMARYN